VPTLVPRGKKEWSLNSSRSKRGEKGIYFRVLEKKSKVHPRFSRVVEGGGKAHSPSRMKKKENPILLFHVLSGEKFLPQKKRKKEGDASWGKRSGLADMERGKEKTGTTYTTPYNFRRKKRKKEGRPSFLKYRLGGGGGGGKKPALPYWGKKGNMFEAPQVEIHLVREGGDAYYSPSGGTGEGGAGSYSQGGKEKRTRTLS